MNDCMAKSDLEELGKSVVSDFERRVAAIPKDLCAPFRSEARNLETELLFLYKAVVMCVKRTEDLSAISSLWGVMVTTCQQSLVRLSELKNQHPTCNAGDYYDRIADLQAKCERLRQMHA
jgi:hypothetical protein